MNVKRIAQIILSWKNLIRNVHSMFIVIWGLFSLANIFNLTSIWNGEIKVCLFIVQHHASYLGCIHVEGDINEISLVIFHSYGIVALKGCQTCSSLWENIPWQHRNHHNRDSHLTHGSLTTSLLSKYIHLQEELKCSWQPLSLAALSLKPHSPKLPRI